MNTFILKGPKIGVDTKERITKERTLQKSENKRAKLQKSESTKERIYKRANVTKERMLQKSEFYKTANFFKLSFTTFKCLLLSWKNNIK